MLENRKLQVQDHVIFIDRHWKRHHALVTAVHGTLTETSIPCINLVYVSEDASRSDGHGRQLIRESSCVHRINNSARANCWVFPDEV